MTAETERKAIHDLWPAHIPHLVPSENRMGQPYTDTEHGIVCNCGDVLGWPKDAPASAEVVEVVEHRYDATSAMTGQDNPEVQGYEGAPRPGDGEIYTDPSGIQWKSTAEHPHPDDPRFKYYAQEVPEPPGDDMSEGEAAFLVMSGAYDEPPYDVQEQATATLRRRDLGDDPADEAQVTTQGRPVQDVQLPAVTDEQMAAAGDREGFHRALENEAWQPQGPEDPPGFDGKLPARPTDVLVPADPLDTRVTVIDPTLPYGPEQVEYQLLRIEGQLERGIHFQRFWEERLHYAKVAFELANARALVAATGGDAGTRKAQALLACEQEYMELAVCETMVRSVRECMHTLRSLQTGYQTISNSVGATYRSRPQGA